MIAIMLACCLPVQADNSDLVMRAMQDEMARSMQRS